MADAQTRPAAVDKPAIAEGPARVGATDPRVSIVVLTHDRCGELRRTLRGLARNAPGHPVIVVDNASRDGTRDCVLREFPNAVYLRSPANLGAAGRNLGVRACRTPYVAFSDDDTCWEPGALERAAGLLDAAPGVAVASAAVRVGAAGRPDPACRAMAASPLPRQGLPGPRLLGFMAGACVMRTAAFRQAGGYWPDLFIGGEEALLALDLAELGWDMVYAPQVATRHWPSPRRDAPGRRLLLARNAIWTAWLRFPLREAAPLCAEALAALPRRRDRLRALVQALAGLPRLWPRRRVLSPRVRAMHARLRAVHGGDADGLPVHVP